MKYIVSRGDSASELEDFVKVWLDLGYRPHGGISVTSYRVDEFDNELRFHYAQAMVLLGEI